MLDLLNNLIKNWKTSIMGLVALSFVVAFLLGRITPDQLLTLIGVVVGGGLLAAKDGNVSGK